jgi:hypothetical protein
MDVKDKKKKLTLKNFSGGSAAVSSYARGAGNKSVLVEKKKNRSIDISQSVESFNNSSRCSKRKDFNKRRYS